MPRRVLLALVCAVLALHLLALRHLPLGGSAAGAAPQRLAFQTRTVEPPAPPPAPPAPALAVPAKAKPPAPTKAQRPPAPRPRPSPRPPAPAPAPTPAVEPTESPQPAATDMATSIASPSGEDGPALPDSTNTVALADATSAAAPAPAPTASAPVAAASTAAATASSPETPASTTVAEKPVSEDTIAGITIQAPGTARPTAEAEAPPVRLPASARLRFEVTGEAKRFHYNANAELLWRNLGATYEARQEVKAFLLGSRSQTSTGRLTPQGLQPVRFGDRSRSEQAAHFDHDGHIATFSANTPSAPIGAGAQDRLSVFIQLGALLAAAPDRYPPGTQITVTTVSARNADRWAFTVEGTETLDLPIGPTPALKLQRLPRSDRDRDQKAELWLGTGLGYLPVRIRITQSNGDFADLALREHEAP